MKYMKLISIFLLTLVLSISPQMASAEVGGLTKCSESPAFEKRLNASVKKLEQRVAKYEVGSAPAIALEKQINTTKTRFDKYNRSELLCGNDGLPHLIADGRWSHAGEFILPGFMFLYITGWIGWVGRSYLQFTKTTDKPNENEIIIDVPVAIGMMSSGFLWPLSAWNELVSGKLLVPGNEVTVSPR